MNYDYKIIMINKKKSVNYKFKENDKITDYTNFIDIIVNNQSLKSNIELFAEY